MSTVTKESKEDKDAVKARAPEKKRRRMIKTDSRSADGASSTAVSETNTREVVFKKPKTESKDDRGRTLFYKEEEDVDNRNPQKDLDLHKQACEELRKMMSKIKTAKDQLKPESSALDEARIHGVLQFVTLKKLNRIGHLRSKKARDATNEAKQQIEQHYLQLQNLLYEVTHLKKEINKCLQFKSTDEDVNLVPVEQFYKEAPKEISKPEITRKDLHQQTLTRLDWELEQRKRLSKKLDQSKKLKEKSLEEIRTMRENLESLQPKLTNIMQATKPVQEHLGLRFDEIREQHKTARYLPRPLYVLFMQSSAYRDACDQDLEVGIHGDVDEAKALDSSGPVEDEESDSDAEDQEEKSTKKRRHRHSTSQQQQRHEKILKKHPLSITLRIKCQSKDNSTIQLNFFYLISLEIITVTVKLFHDLAQSSVSGSDLLSSGSLLNCLYPDDLGDDTPNPANKFALNKHGIQKFSTFISELGHPYQWAQNLCGLEFLTENEPPKVSSDLCASHIEETITRLRNRVQSRLSLQVQLASLERCSVPVSSESQKLFPVKILSRLHSWRRSTYEDFVALKYTKSLVDAEVAGPNDLFFTGVVDRGSAKMTFQVVVNPDYPSSPPLFSVNIQWQSERNSLNCENIRDLEAEVNVFFEELIVGKSHDQLLTNQVQRLLMCFDVYLETESENMSLAAPVEFAKEKIFPRVTRGPHRSRPYKFNSQLGFFSHR